MKLSTVKQALDNVFPEGAQKVTYRAFVGPVEPPFICYMVVESIDLMADNTNYYSISVVDVELYTERKDLELEAAVEEELVELGLAWAKAETFIEDEDLLQVTYTVSFGSEPESVDVQ